MQIVRPQSSGFTLIELMITVAIVGILAAIAYPSYQDSVRKSWRANGASCLMELAQRMERRYTGTSSYAGGVPASECNDANSDMVNNRYTFAFATTPALTATTFQLQAQPVDPGPQADDSCGTLTIDQTGLKGSAGTVSDCWRR